MRPAMIGDKRISYNRATEIFTNFLKFYERPINEEHLNK